MIGKTLSHYRILEKIGQGGMGEVYRAEDTTLKRKVAIKLLPEQFTQDTERLARLQREAQILASLNHPCIAAIYGLEKADGVRFLVLELVEGETLADQLSRGPLPMGEALEVCCRIAEGLEVAHESGIVHRDLKPANVKVNPEGKVKVLDFGLAKAQSPELTKSELANSPTITSDMTRVGVILGTAAYMSPEQARGKPVDRRADIWAFGCVLYECLTGTRLFTGESVTDILGTVLHTEPDWGALPGKTPRRVRDLLRRCLEKDPYERLRDIGDARIEIRHVLERPSDDPYGEVLTAIPGRWQRPIPLAAMALLTLLIGVVLGFVWNHEEDRLPVPPTVARFAIHLPEGRSLPWPPAFSPLGLSPDGTQLVYVGDQDGTRRLYLRPIAELEAEPIRGTEAGVLPFFSPDGKWLGFGSKVEDMFSLRKVSLLGGAPLSLKEERWLGRGASWGRDGTIVYGDQGGLWRVSETGGTPEHLGNGSLPEILPGDRAVVFGRFKIGVLSLETGEAKDLIEDGLYPRYAATGHLLYGSLGGDLMAASFDLEELRVTGPPTPVVEGAGFQYDISETGTLAYVPGGGRKINQSTLVWVDRQGQASRVTELQVRFAGPRISPDGKRVAVTRDDSIWIYEIDRDNWMPVSSDGHFPLWAPDGSRIAFYTQAYIAQTAADGSGEVEPLTEAQHPMAAPTPWSPDGQVLAYQAMTKDTKTNFDIWTRRRGGEPEPFVATESREVEARFSPDGNWIVFTSNRSGRNEVYAARFPGGGRLEPISRNGGQNPVWAPDGKELFYRNSDRMMVVSIQTEPSFKPGDPSPLFAGNFYDQDHWPSYDIAPDGERFVMMEKVELEPLTQINVVLNWFEELKRLVPTDN